MSAALHRLWLESLDGRLLADFIRTPEVQEIMRRGAEEMFYGQPPSVPGDFAGLAERYSLGRKPTPH